MIDLLQEIIDILHSMNSGFNWDALSSVCTALSLVAIIILLIERNEKKRPYLQITFELVKSNIVCLVIRNVGESPAVLREILFNNEFVSQLPSASQKHMQNRNDLRMSIYPKQQWVISLNIVTSEIFKYKCHILNATLKYTDSATKISKKPKYIEDSHVCFDDYISFMVYISETDELRSSIKDLNKTINRTGSKIAKAFSVLPEVVKTSSFMNIEDIYTKNLVTEISKKQSNDE